MAQKVFKSPLEQAEKLVYDDTVAPRISDLFKVDSPQEVADSMQQQVVTKSGEVFKPNKTLRDRWNRYLKSGFSGKNIDYWNREIQDISDHLPFADQVEKEKWLNQAATWMGEPEWIDFTNSLIDRYGGK